MSSLGRDTIVYAMSIAVDRLVGFLLLPVLTRLISPQDFGLWTQSVVVASMLIPIVLMGFQTALVHFFSATSEQDPVRRSLTAAMLTAILMVLSLFGVVAAFWPNDVAGLVFGVESAAVLVLPLFFLVATEAGHEFAVGHMRASGRIQRLAIYLSIKSVLRLLVPVATLAVLNSSLDEVLLALAVAQAILLVQIVWREMSPAAYFRIGLAQGKSRWAEVSRYALPLVALAMLTMAHNFADRFFLAHLLGLEYVAVYAAVSSVVAMAAVFYTVQGFALFPALARLFAEEQREEAGRITARALYFFVYCAWPLILLLTALSPTLLPMLTTQEYRASPLVFLLLGGAMMGFGIYQIQLYLVLLSGRGLSGLSMMTAALCVNSVLNVLVIPLAGLTGAAGVACLSNLLLAVLTGRAAREGVSFAFPWRKTLGISARGMLAALCIMAAGYGVDLSSPPVMLAALLAGALLYILPDMFRPGSPPRLLLGMS